MNTYISYHQESEFIPFEKSKRIKTLYGLKYNPWYDRKYSRYRVWYIPSLITRLKSVKITENPSGKEQFLSVPWWWYQLYEKAWIARRPFDVIKLCPWHHNKSPGEKGDSSESLNNPISGFSWCWCIGYYNVEYLHRLSRRRTMYMTCNKYSLFPPSKVV